MSSKTDKSTHLATTPPESKKSANQPFRNKGLRGRKRQNGPPTSGISITNPPSPGRRRTEEQAKSILMGIGLEDRQLKGAIRRVRKAKQPIREAKRIAQRAYAAKKDLDVPSGRKLDLSDAEELKAKLLKRDFGIWSPQSDYLLRIQKDICSGNITKAEFERRSAVLLDMVQPLSKEFRKAEWKLARTGEWE